MLTVLIVDDEADVRTYLETLFADNGYRPVCCADGESALKAARELRPDLVCLDITMPPPTGVKVYRALRGDSGLKAIPVIIVSAVTGPRGTLDEYAAFLGSRKSVPPPDGFIAKPIDKEELLALARKLTG